MTCFELRGSPDIMGHRRICSAEYEVGWKTDCMGKLQLDRVVLVEWGMSRMV